MAITIDSVTQVRDFDVLQQALTGSALYYVMFSADTPAELQNYTALAAAALVATDPVTSLAIPTFGAQMPDFATWVVDIRPKLYKGQNAWWSVKVTYAPPELAIEATETFDEDPTLSGLIYDWGNLNEREKIWQDANGVPILMSSGEGPTQLPVIDNDILSCTVSRRTDTYSPLVSRTVVNRINDAPFTIDGVTFEIGTVKCKAWRGRKQDIIVQIDGSPPFAKTVVDEALVFLIKEEPWLGRVFDQGLFYNEENTSDLVMGRHQISRNGQIVRSPQPLNGAALPIFDDAGNIANVVVPVAYDPIGKTPGVESIFGGKGAMLTFQFWKEEDFSVTGVN